MSEERAKELDAMIGTKETRKLVEKIARGKKVEAEEIIKDVIKNIGTFSHAQLVDLDFCLKEWEKKKHWFWPNRKTWEKNVQFLAPAAWYADSLVGTVAGMVIYTVLTGKHQEREKRFPRITFLVHGEILRRLKEQGKI